jgi:hypothetical protein
MLLATGISTRFNQFNDYFIHILGHENLMTRHTWKFMRFHYNRLLDLVCYVDNRISFLTFLCLSHNVFILGVKVFDGIKSKRLNAMGDVYFWFFMMTMVTRIVGVLMACAQLNKSAIKPLELIPKVPSKYWTLDVSQKFIKLF